MIAARLHLWRLANFEVERLVSADDVYLFHCVARDNPADVRMIAVAEVRDLTPLCDAEGAVTALPQLEHRGFFTDLPFPGDPGRLLRVSGNGVLVDGEPLRPAAPPPRLGQHNALVSGEEP